MRESRLLKVISYILIPILIAIMVISCVYAPEKQYYDEEEYFNSDNFACSYLTGIRNNLYNLIYNYNINESIKIGNTEVFYGSDNYNFSTQYYYLIIYKNRALTNVQIADDNITLDDIKTYINDNDNSIRFNYIKGKAESSNKNILKNINYFDNISYTGKSINSIVEEGVSNVYIKDFEIYSSYIPEFKENSYQARVSELINVLKPFEKFIYVAIPISAVGLLIILTYLIIAIGYTKGKVGIDLNDFDKIPLEIILFIAILIISISLSIGVNVSTDLINLEICTIVTVYLIIYCVSAITINTIIKRIKSKTLGDSTWIIRIIRWIIRKCKEIFATLFYSTNTTVRLLLYLAGIVIISILLFAIFDEGAIFLEIIFLGYVIYKIIKETICFNKIKDKLKEMYEGNNNNKLDESEFTINFKEVVQYINDISNGFENAIQEGMKSERLKTELITNVSHDIKTPLTSIINYVDLLKQEDIKNEKAKEYIEVLNQKSQRLKKLTEDLIEASKASSGNVKLNVEKINICELIKQTTGEFKDKFNEKKLDIITDIPKEEIYIKADNRYMYRIIENLFSNISKYALENSRVYIDIISINDKVKIELKNISKDKLNITADELMQRFVRGDKSRTTEGSGLGISISKSLTELQNGEFIMGVDGDLFKVELIFSQTK